MRTTNTDMPEKSKNSDHPFRRSTAEAALWMAFALFGLALIFFAVGWKLASPVRFYALYVLYSWSAPILACAVVPVIAFILSRLVRNRPGIFEVVPVLMLLTSMVFWVSAGAIPGNYMQKALVSAGNYVYRADYEEYHATGEIKGRVYLYRCDSLSLMCDIVFSHPDRSFYSGSTLPLRIELKAEAEKVVLSMNGEVIYAEQP
jgi:hypothetical protein